MYCNVIVAIKNKMIIIIAVVKMLSIVGAASPVIFRRHCIIHNTMIPGCPSNQWCNHIGYL